MYSCYVVVVFHFVAKAILFLFPTYSFIFQNVFFLFFIHITLAVYSHVEVVVVSSTCITQLTTHSVCSILIKVIITYGSKLIIAVYLYKSFAGSISTLQTNMTRVWIIPNSGHPCQMIYTKRNLQ